ncbi:HAMP domain-containing histidine kinase [Spirosoma sp. KCTC 42546]|uniref:sensor histidine kinase n=1 Tax=Spirosoma sp. KCTC 42546 TaxID=2520506 RepID=UPI00115966F7|nr:HAMP domain-containing sensor histidine kinase [Spirosoma sp. KCTC 42546]QDK81025.1 HAMP domain-containing histidine kinase [Spirosoma sp. KCTC 42546]
MTAVNVKPSRLYPATYGRLAVLLSLLVFLLVAGYSVLTGFVAIRYFKATHQRLNREVATHIAKFSQPFVGMHVNQKATERIFFDAMVTNPSAEVYLLDTTGRVMVYEAPAEKIKRHQISLEPIRQFIQTKGLVFIQGDDPKLTDGQQVFSAAEVRDQGRLQGYVYVVLLGESYGTTSMQLLQDYAFEWGLKTTLFMLLAALVVGFVVFNLLTRDLTHIIKTVMRFRDGDLTARTQLKPTSDLKPLANAFNTMADQLARSLDQLQTSEKLRRDLVANVSHDLRSPMTSIRGYAETLDMDASLNPTQKQYIGAILQSSYRLTRRINELFELSKLEAKERQPEKEPFLLSDLVTETYTNFRLMAQEKGVAFTCVNCEVPSVCYADINMVEHVLQNLVENAIHYSPEGGHVQLQLASNGQFVTVSVSNSVGLLPTAIQDYLSAINQIDNVDTVVRPPNSGLGLAIVMKILTLHASQLRISHPSETEICFSFEVPVYVK